MKKLTAVVVVLILICLVLGVMNFKKDKQIRQGKWTTYQKSKWMTKQGIDLLAASDSGHVSLISFKGEYGSHKVDFWIYPNDFKSDSVITRRNQSIDSLQHQLDWYENQWDIVNEDTQNNYQNAR